MLAALNDQELKAQLEMQEHKARDTANQNA